MVLEVQEDKIINADRGHVYEFFDGKSDETRYVLVVSNDNRKCDRFVNVLMLGNYSTGRDTLRINLPVFDEPKFVHCGMVSYTKRSFLMEDVGVLPEEVMLHIDKLIAKELGIYENIRLELAFYKTQYNNMINRLVAAGKELQSGNQESGDKVQAEEV